MMTSLWRGAAQRQADKSLRVNLRSVYGRGDARITAVCRRLGILPSRRWGELGSASKARLGQWREGPGAAPLSSGGVGDRARREEVVRIQRRMALGTVQGIRRRLGLPVRGQRTHTNGATARRLNSGRGRG